MSVAATNEPVPPRRRATPRLVATLALFVLTFALFCGIVGTVLVQRADDRQELERRTALLGAVEDLRASGADFTSADVVATMDRMVEAGKLSSYMDKGGCAAIDDFTVEFTLKNPDGQFPYNVCHWNPQTVITPKDYATGTTLDASQSVGVTIGVATATGTANNPAPTVAPPATAATSTGTATAATNNADQPAGLASGTGAARAPTAAPSARPTTASPACSPRARRCPPRPGTCPPTRRPARLTHDDTWHATFANTPSSSSSTDGPSITPDASWQVGFAGGLAGPWSTLE